MDVKTVFLNANLEKIYMTQLERCVVSGQKNKMCKQQKAFYCSNSMEKLFKFLLLMDFPLSKLISVFTLNL